MRWLYFQSFADGVFAARGVEPDQGVDRDHHRGLALQQGSGDVVDQQGHRADAGGPDQVADALQVHR